MRLVSTKLLLWLPVPAAALLLLGGVLRIQDKHHNARTRVIRQVAIDHFKHAFLQLPAAVMGSNKRSSACAGNCQLFQCDSVVHAAKASLNQTNSQRRGTTVSNALQPLR